MFNIEEKKFKLYNVDKQKYMINLLISKRKILILSLYIPFYNCYFVNL